MGNKFWTALRVNSLYHNCGLLKHCEVLFVFFYLKKVSIKKKDTFNFYSILLKGLDLQKVKWVCVKAIA